jgi:cell wall assembly regulator SMI1
MQANNHVWPLLETQLSQHVPDLLKRLRRGVSEATIVEFEFEIQQSLPKDLKVAYVRHDGCDYDDQISTIGLFGRQQWRPLAKLRQLWQFNTNSFDSENPYFYTEDDDQWKNLPIRPWTSAPNSWIPVGESGSPDDWYIDLCPGPAGESGQLIRDDVDGCAKFLIASSLNDYLMALEHGLANGCLRAGFNQISGCCDWLDLGGRSFKLQQYKQVFG